MKSPYIQAAGTLTLNVTKSWNPTNFWIDFTGQTSTNCLYGETYLDMGTSKNLGIF